MNKRIKKILKTEIPLVYPRGMKDENKYEYEKGNLFWIFVSVEALYDLYCVLFKVGPKQLRAKKVLKLKANKVAILISLILFIVAIFAIIEGIRSS